MADTGAPWNIPFVEPTDIPRGYPADSEDLALAIAAGLSAAGNPGIGSNVVQSIKTTQQIINSTSFQDVTDLSVTITPTSDTSKVLVLYNIYLSHGNADGQRTIYVLVRNSTQIFLGTSGSGTNTTGLSLNNLITGNHAGQFLDSPSTTSAVTYKIQVRATAIVFGGAQVNREGNTDSFTTVSSITAIEVAA